MRCQQHGFNNAAGAEVLTLNHIDRVKERIRKRAVAQSKTNPALYPVPKNGAFGSDKGLWPREVIFTAAKERGFTVRRCRFHSVRPSPAFNGEVARYLEKNAGHQLLLYLDYDVVCKRNTPDEYVQGVGHCVALRDHHIIDSQLKVPVPWTEYYLLRYVSAVYSIASALNEVHVESAHPRVTVPQQSALLQSRSGRAAVRKRGGRAK